MFATNAGGCPAASPFLLLRQKKVTKEKATPGSSALTGCPALLTNAGRCGTRARSSNVLMVWFVLALRQSSRTSPAFAPLLGDSHGAPCRNATTEINLVIPAKAGIQVLSKSNWIPSYAEPTVVINHPGPDENRRVTQKRQGSPRGLFEGEHNRNLSRDIISSPSSAAACRFEVRQGFRVPRDAPAERESHEGLSEGHPALLRGDEPRVAFLWSLSLAKQRK